MKSVDSLEQFVNLPELLVRIENDHELLVELLTLFQEDLPGSRKTLHIAIIASNLHEIERTAHSLKGMLANLSVKHTASLAAELESAARAGDLPRIRDVMAEFDPEITSLSSTVDSFIAGA